MATTECPCAIAIATTDRPRRPPAPVTTILIGPPRAHCDELRVTPGGTSPFATRGCSPPQTADPKWHIPDARWPPRPDWARGRGAAHLRTRSRDRPRGTRV